MDTLGCHNTKIVDFVRASCRTYKQEHEILSFINRWLVDRLLTMNTRCPYDLVNLWHVFIDIPLTGDTWSASFVFASVCELALLQCLSLGMRANNERNEFTWVIRTEKKRNVARHHNRKRSTRDTMPHSSSRHIFLEAEIRWSPSSSISTVDGAHTGSNFHSIQYPESTFPSAPR